MRFVATATYTVTGWIEVQAENMEEAKRKVKELNEKGIELHDMKDTDTSTEVCLTGEFIANL